MHRIVRSSSRPLSLSFQRAQRTAATASDVSASPPPAVGSSVGSSAVTASVRAWTSSIRNHAGPFLARRTSSPSGALRCSSIVDRHIRLFHLDRQQQQQQQQGQEQGQGQWQGEAKASPLVELRRLRQLILEVDATNSRLNKERILAEFPDLLPILQFLYNARTRFQTTSVLLQKYLRMRNAELDWLHNVAPRLTTSSATQYKTKRAALTAAREEAAIEEAPDTLLELFEKLRKQEVRGAMAPATITVFLEKHGILAEHEEALAISDTGDPEVDNQASIRKSLMKPTVLEVFMRCLDRNLQAGFGEKMLVQAFGDNEAPKGKAAKGKKGKEKQRQLDKGAEGPKQSGMKASHFQVALGRSVTTEELPNIFTAKNGQPQSWYASRKLDGVRCIVFVDFKAPLPASSDESLVIHSIEMLSRTGGPFTTLDKVKADLTETLAFSPHVRAMVMQEALHSPHLCKRRIRIVLDGEVCSLAGPGDEETPETSYVPTSDSVAMADGSSNKPLTPGGWRPSSYFTESFRDISGGIRRKDHTIPRPTYFPFDLLTEREFTQWQNRDAFGAGSPPMLSSEDDGHSYVAHRPFSSRVSSLSSLMKWCQGERRQHASTLRLLDQRLVCSPEELQPLTALAVKEGWEGVMLRESSSVYVGKRHPRLLKLKEWQEAEYRIESVQIAPMRLSLEDGYKVRDAVASISIRHRGTEVRVGSGLTTKQRVEWAKEPESIVGKWCTVAYFQESESKKREAAAAAGADIVDQPHEVERLRLDVREEGEVVAAKEEGGVSGGGARSLRFSRLKRVWLEGERDM